MISTSGAFSLEMTVPGAQVSCGGTTAVAVSPTHRRQGVLREMMRAHLADVKEHGEPIAALWASDSAIYGRFGYGCASICYEVQVEPRHATSNRLAPEPERSSLIARAEALEIVPPLYDRLRMVIPGFFARTPEWWEDRSFRESGTSGGGGALRYAIVEGDEGISVSPPTGRSRTGMRARLRKGDRARPFRRYAGSVGGNLVIGDQSDLVVRAGQVSGRPGTRSSTSWRGHAGPVLSDMTPCGCV